MKLFRLSKSLLSLRFIAIVVLILIHSSFVTTLIFYFMAGHHQMVEDVTKENYLNFSSTIAQLMGEAIYNKDMKSISWHLIQMEDNPDIIYSIVYDKKNTLLNKRIKSNNDHLFSHALKERQDEQPEKVTFKEMGHPHGFFHKEGHHFDFLVPIYWDQKYIGKVQIGINTSRVNQRVAKESILGIKLIVVFILAGLIIITLIDRRIKKNLSHLITITRKMAKGDLTERINIRTGDELEILGNSFNVMAEAIQERKVIIERHKTHLEEMVRVKTGELAEERDKLKAILDNVPSAIIMMDKDLKILMVNEQFESLIKKQASEILGKYCAKDICYWCDEESCLSKKCLEKGEIKSSIIHMTDDSQYELHLEHLAVPLYHDGKTYGALEVITDVTEKYEMQYSLVRAEKLSTIGEMAAILAHEIRNSLTSVKMILQLLLEKREKYDRESVIVSLNSILQMEQIVNDLLSFSHQAKIKKSFQDLHELLRESVQFTSHQFQKKSIDVVFDFDSDISRILIDKDNMNKVFINLLINAAQAIPDSGSIKISTNKSVLSRTLYDYASSPSDTQKVLSSVKIFKIVLEKGEPVINIEVTDTGQGIGEDSISRIFDPFYTTKINGTGLGLSLVKRIVNAHNGIITVHSEQNKGTTFSIYLPLKETV